MDKPVTAAKRKRFLQSVGLVMQAFEECGFKTIPIDPKECRRLKKADRLEDRRLLATGAVTADELQERNAFFKGPVKILDLSAAYK